MRKHAILTALLLACSSAARAQMCELDDTLLKCWNRYNAAVAMAEEVEDDVATTNTGVPAVTGLPMQSSLRDFLNIFAAAVDTATLSESESSLTLDWTVPFGFVADNDKLKLQAVFGTPALLPALKTKLGDDAEAIAALEDELNDTDDVLATVTYAPQNTRFGRSIRPHADFLEGLYQAAAPSETAELQALAILIGELAEVVPGLDQDTRFDELPAGTAPGVMAQLAARARATNANTEAMQEALDALVTLLNNQPQFYGTGSYHYRNELVGPSEWSGKVTYELGRKSLNRFLDDNRASCDVTAIKEEVTASVDAPVKAQGCLAQLLTFAKTAKTEAGASNRLVASFEYVNVDDVDIHLPKYALDFVERPSHSLVYSLTYGVPLATPVKDREARLDFAFNYDDIPSDAELKDRWVGSVTYTQKITDTVTLPIALVYANHEKFLPDVDKRLGVHFGLSYKLPDPTP